MKSLCVDHKSLRASTLSFDAVGWGSSDSPCSSPLRSSFPRVCYRLGVGSGNSWSLPGTFAVPSSTENVNSSSFCVINTSFALIFSRVNFGCVQILYTLRCRQSGCLLSKFLPRSMHTQEISLVRLLCHIDEVWIYHVMRSDDTQSLLRMVLLVLWMVLRIVFHGDFPVCQEVLDISQIVIAFHRICPPFFHPILIEAKQLKYNSSTLRTALSAMQFVSDRWGVDVLLLHDNSSQDLPHSNEPYV